MTSSRLPPARCSSAPVGLARGDPCCHPAPFIRHSHPHHPDDQCGPDHRCTVSWREFSGGGKGEITGELGLLDASSARDSQVSERPMKGPVSLSRRLYTRALQFFPLRVTPEVLQLDSTAVGGSQFVIQVWLPTAISADVSVALALSDSTRGTLNATAVTIPAGDTAMHPVLLTLAASDPAQGTGFFVDLTATSTAFDEAAVMTVVVTDSRPPSLGQDRDHPVPLSSLPMSYTGSLAKMTAGPITDYYCFPNGLRFGIDVMTKSPGPQGEQQGRLVGRSAALDRIVFSNSKDGALAPVLARGTPAPLGLVLNRSAPRLLATRSRVLVRAGPDLWLRRAAMRVHV